MTLGTRWGALGRVRVTLGGPWKGHILANSRVALEGPGSLGICVSVARPVWSSRHIIYSVRAYLSVTKACDAFLIFLPTLQSVAVRF